jgi:hypothetical protein
MPSYVRIEQPDVYKFLVARALTQVYMSSFFAKASATEFNEAAAFERGSTVSLRRPKNKGEAEDYNPRNSGGNAAASVEPGYVNVDLTLDHLFTDAFPVYAHDANPERYIVDYSEVAAGAIRTSYEKSAYRECFRDYSTIPASGIVNFSASSPLQIVASMDGVNNTGANFAPFNAGALTNASTVLDRNDVATSQRYTALSATAKGSFIGDTPMNQGFVAAQIGAGGILQGGLPMGQLVERYGFLCGGSNAVSFQPAVAAVVSGSATVPVASTEADTTVFFAEDNSVLTPLGAVRITADASFITSAGGVAVGQVAQIRNAGGTVTIALGVILRITGADIWMVPYSPTGVQLQAAQIPADSIISVPLIGSVNVSYQREHLVTASRALQTPTDGSGAIAIPASDPESGLVMQLLKGSYDVDRFKEGCRLAMLCGFRGTDHRKAVLNLSV